MAMGTTYSTGKANWTFGEKIAHEDWHTYKGPCPLCGSPTFNYGGGWRCMAMYCSNDTSNPAPSVGPEPEWWDTDVQVVYSGLLWMAYDSSFKNITESLCGFGRTPGDAITQFFELKDLKNKINQQ